MKFVWFNLQPWPYLPKDFREKYRSVWVDIPNSLFDPVKGHEMYNTYLDQLEFADSVGYDGIGCNEHHQNGYGLMPSPNLIAATLARRTSTVGDLRDRQLDRRLQPAEPRGRGVRDARLHLGRAPRRRLPGRHADGHQLLHGPDPGPHPRQVRRGARPDHPGVDQREPVRVRRQVQPAALRQHWPLPIQKPHPPIYIPGGGSIETWDFCLDHDYNYSYLSFTGYKAGKALLDGFWERRAERGDPTRTRTGRASPRSSRVADTDAEAEKLYAEHILYFFNNCLHVYPGFSDPPGYRTINTIKAGKLNQLRQETMEMFENLTWKRPRRQRAA